jgi:hypothetical protein
MAAPWSLHPASRVVTDNPDTHLYLWTLGWDVHALVGQPLAIFDANIYHPLPNTLAYSENALGSALLAAPVIWLTGDLVLALNLVLLASCALCGVGAYVLARQLGLGRGAAIVCGLVFAFAPTRLNRISQLHLDAVQWVPFCLAFVHRYLTGGARRDLRLALAFFTLQALTSGHGAVMLVVALAVVLVAALVRGTPAALGRRLRDAGLGGAALLVPAVMVWLPYRRARLEVGLDRTYETWAVTPESFLASPTIVHRAILSWFTERDLADTASAFLFPGYLVLILAAVALWPRPAGLDRAPGVRRDAWTYAAIGLISVAFYVHGPFDLWPWVRGWPGFNFIRVPSRFSILTTLALAVLAGMGFERLASRARWQWFAAAAASVLLLAEYSSHPFTGVRFALPAPAIVQWLDTLPGPLVLAEVPIPRITQAGPFERFETAAMLHTTRRWPKTIHGYSGVRPGLHDRLFRELNTFPDDTSLASLRAVGVTHVVVHRGEYGDGWPAMDRRLRATPGLRLLHEEPDGTVFELVREGM